MFFTLLYQPLANALVWLYSNVAGEDLGIAIILLTVLIRVIFFPFFHKMTRSQKVMQKIQPKIKEVQKKYKDPKEQAKKMMALYKEHKVNPFSGIGFLIIQLPILIALYRVFLSDFNAEFFESTLYGFVVAPEEIHSTFLGLINLSERSIIVVGLAALAQYIQGKLAIHHRHNKKEPVSKMEEISRKMVYFGPALTLLIFWNFPSAVALYWLTTSIFSIGQQFLVNKKLNENKQNDAKNGGNKQ